MVDHYTKQVHLFPVTSQITADGVASIYFDYVFPLHGIPRKIISDRGPQFAARSMRALYKQLGIDAGLTTAYHPQANGQVERKNQEVEAYLRLFISKRQDDWVDLLPVAFVPCAGPDCILTGYDYSPGCIISHGLLSSGVLSHVRY